MPISLHAAFVPTALQIVGATRALVDKAEEWCASEGHDAETLIECRLIEDMLPFNYQVKSVALHTGGAVDAVKVGEFEADFTDPPTSFDGLRERLERAKKTLEAVTEEELEAVIGKDMVFTVPGSPTRFEFTADDFLMTFSQPNYFFHAATAYDLLRMKGMNIGKRDWLLGMRGKMG